MNQPYKKCLAYDCDEEATPGYPCCSITHGYDLKTIPPQIKRAQREPGTYYVNGLDNEGNVLTIDVSWLSRSLGLRNLSINELEFYAQAAEVL